jgi:[ribosomal protein S18]-alanine N-acetyltransferase
MAFKMKDGNDTIRKFRLKDLVRVLEIERVAFKDPYNHMTFYLFYQEYPDTFWVYEKNGKVVGYVMFTTEGHIINIAVDPPYRYKRIGAALMKFAINGIAGEKVWLEVRESNIAAQKFYYKLGFKKEKVIPRYYGHEDAYILTLERRDHKTH